MGQFLRRWWNGDQQAEPRPDRPNDEGPEVAMSPIYDGVQPHPEHDQGPRGAALTQTYPQAASEPREPTFQPVAKFQYLPTESHSIPHITATDDSEAAEIVSDIRDYFNTTAFNARREMDTHLRAFKSSVGKGPNAPLPACCHAWKNRAFGEQDQDVPRGGWFVLEPQNAATTDTPIQAIYVNKHKDELSEDVNAIGSHMEKLLDSCNEILENEAEWKEELQSRIARLSSVQLPRGEADTLRELIQEVDTFCKDATNLLKDIKAAIGPVRTKPIATTGMKVVSVNLAEGSQQREIDTAGSGFDTSQTSSPSSVEVGAHYCNLDTTEKSGIAGDLQTHSEDLHPRFREVRFLSGSPWCDLVASKAKKVHWDEIGVYFDIPEGAVPPNKLLNLTVWPCIKGPFVPPPGYQFASPVFIIGPEFKFQKKILLQLSHFIRLQSSDDCEKMVFLSARSTSQSGKDGKLEYHFKVLKGGSFEVGQPEGSINLSHFCALAAGKEITAGGEVCYSVQLHHSQEAMKAFFVVSIVDKVYSKNLKDFLEEQYPGATFERSIKQPVEFTGNEVILHVPDPEDSRVSGWVILPAIIPCKIFRKEVDFPLLHSKMPDQIPDYPPKLPLTLELEYSHPPLSPFRPCRLPVGGLAEPWSFMLVLHKSRHPRPVTPLSPVPAAVAAAANGDDAILGQGDLINITDHLHALVEKHDIRNLGLVLGLHHDRLKVIEQTTHGYLDDVIAAWLRREGDVDKVGGPRWSTLVKALQHHRLRQSGIAKDIAVAKGLESLIEDMTDSVN